MTPEFAAGFNAGIEAARKVAITYPDNYTDPVAAHAELMTGARIANAISALTVPSNLVAVPREPTEAMVEQARYTIPGPIGREICDADIEDIYRAMIAATEERG